MSFMHADLQNRLLLIDSQSIFTKDILIVVKRRSEVTILEHRWQISCYNGSGEIHHVVVKVFKLCYSHGLVFCFLGVGRRR